MPNQTIIKSTKSKLPPKGWLKKHRVTAFQTPPPPLYRRVFRFFFNPLTVLIFCFALLGVFLTLTYFWFDYSERIDRRLLSGQVYTPSAGIYSAPKTLLNGENLTLEDLIDYLKSAGYVEKNNQADAARSRYRATETQVEIEPGITGVIDDEKIFHELVVKFDKNRKIVKSISDVTLEKDVGSAQLEPKILSSIAEEGDGRRKAVSFQDLPPHMIKAITVTEDRAFFDFSLTRSPFRFSVSRCSAFF